jgi:hypothetical protein
MTYFIKYENIIQVNLGESGTQTEIADQDYYDFRVEINSIEDLTYVSVPSHSNVTTVKKDKLNKAVIEKKNAKVEDLKKDIVIYFQTRRMDRPQLLAQPHPDRHDELACLVSLVPTFTPPKP